jgi:hypothetical protein
MAARLQGIEPNKTRRELVEGDVRRIATDQQEPSDVIALLISSVLDSRTGKPQRLDGAV